MLYMVCASTPKSSIRIFCYGAIEAKAKAVELQESGIGSIHICDDTGQRVSDEEFETHLAAAAAKAEKDASPPVWLMTTRHRPSSKSDPVE